MQRYKNVTETTPSQKHGNVAPSISAQENLRLDALYKPEYRHRGWERLKVDGQPEGFQIFKIDPAQKPRGIISFLTGNESSPLYFNTAINEMAKRGFHVIAAAQLNRRQYPDNLERNLKIAEWLCLDDRSPAIELHKETNLPLYLSAHSAGVTMINAWLYAKPENLERAYNLYTHYFKLAGFFGSTMSTAMYHFQNATKAEHLKAQALSQAYDCYARYFNSRVVGLAPLDKFFSEKFKSDHYRGQALSGVGTTHGDALALRKLARWVIEKTEDARFSISPEWRNRFIPIPSTSIYGRHDEASCVRSGEYEANLTNSHFYLNEAQHALKVGLPQLLDHIEYTIELHERGLYSLNAQERLGLFSKGALSSPFDIDNTPD